MKYLEGHFTGVNKNKLYYQAWKPKDPKAIIIVCHGLGEHSGRYTFPAKHFTKKNLAFYAYDHRGHGKSQGKRGHVDSFNDYIKDLHSFIRLVRRKHGDRKIFLLGHSLGALIVLVYLMHGYSSKLSGAILSALPLELVKSIPAYKRAVGNQLSKIFPTLSFFNEIDPTLLSHDLKVVTSYMNDPLVYRRASIRLLREFLRTMECVKIKPHLIKVPVLIVHGQSDKICHFDGSRKFFEGIGHQDKTFIPYPGFYHEVLNEVKRCQVFKDIDDWLIDRL